MVCSTCCGTRCSGGVTPRRVHRSSPHACVLRKGSKTTGPTRSVAWPWGGGPDSTPTIFTNSYTPPSEDVDDDADVTSSRAILPTILLVLTLKCKSAASGPQQAQVLGWKPPCVRAKLQIGKMDPAETSRKRVRKSRGKGMRTTTGWYVLYIHMGTGNAGWPLAGCHRLRNK